MQKIFEGAKFGDMFKTRDGHDAVYTRSFDENKFHELLVHDCKYRGCNRYECLNVDYGKFIYDDCGNMQYEIEGRYSVLRNYPGPYEEDIVERNDIRGIIDSCREDKYTLIDDSKLTWDTIDDLNSYFGTDYKDFKSVDWYSMSCNYTLPESFIRKFSDNLDWKWISMEQKLSEEFIREFFTYVNCPYISSYQRLSEEFIREFKNCVTWMYISSDQRLSENFIMEFIDKVDFRYISSNQYLSADFIKEFASRLDMSLIRDNWIYRDADFKKKRVVDTGLYECYDDYFIAYTRARTDRYSLLRQHRYDKGCIYESWCDCSNYDISPRGLIVWDKETASDFSGGMVIKVKVRYGDVGRVVQDGKRIRCFRIEVIE